MQCGCAPDPCESSGDLGRVLSVVSSFPCFGPTAGAQLSNLTVWATLIVSRRGHVTAAAQFDAGRAAGCGEECRRATERRLTAWQSLAEQTAKAYVRWVLAGACSSARGDPLLLLLLLPAMPGSAGFWRAGRHGPPIVWLSGGERMLSTAPALSVCLSLPKRRGGTCGGDGEIRTRRCGTSLRGRPENSTPHTAPAGRRLSRRPQRRAAPGHRARP